MPVADDLSTDFGRVRASLVGPDGRSYRELRDTLRPRWWTVWVDLGSTWVTLAAVAAGLWAAQALPSWWAVPVAALGALAVGVLVHRIGLFVHEGAHANLAPGRWNDPLTNLAGGALVLTDVRAYRPLHMVHHRRLGTTGDTERTYFSRLDLGFCLRSATGARVLEVVTGREADRPDRATRHLLVPLLGMMGHAAVVLGAALSGHWVLAGAWAVGVATVFPLVNSLRQLAEHRSPAADGAVDYRKVDMGAWSRMFDRQRGSWVLGAAGFNRHLLHHWDAGVSYTRLAQLEDWLSGTEVGPIIRDREARYLGIVRRLWGA